MNEQLIQSIVEQVLLQLGETTTSSQNHQFPVAVSARHVHLKQEHVEILFGKGYELQSKSELSQPGQFAAQEQVAIVGPKSAIHNVRVLGPARDLSQVEVSGTDARVLGVAAPLRFSGDIAKSSAITIVGPKGSVYIEEGCIIAAAHIHMSPHDASRLQVEDSQLVDVEVKTHRPLIFRNVKIRVSERFKLEMHIDTDEGNAALIQGSAVGEILQQVGESKPLPVFNVEVSQQPKQQTVYEKRVLTERTLADCSHQEFYVSKKTIVTALAEDTARKKGIKIIRQ